jgi:hypothetical protein
MTIALLEETTVAVEWTITIEGKNEFGDTCRKEVRIDKSWECLFDGEIGLSINDGKKLMATLQSAVVAHEAETFVSFVESARIVMRFGQSRTTPEFRTRRGEMRPRWTR